ncbi:hypothetical protein WH47_05915, partial [Habropoda laboriosa]
RHCVLFTFELKKYAVKATKMIYSALGENVTTHKTCKNALGNVYRNLIRRTQLCIQQNGQHFQQFL